MNAKDLFTRNIWGINHYPNCLEWSTDGMISLMCATSMQIQIPNFHEPSLFDIYWINIEESKEDDDTLASAEVNRDFMMNWMSSIPGGAWHGNSDGESSLVFKSSVWSNLAKFNGQVYRSLLCTVLSDNSSYIFDLSPNKRLAKLSYSLDRRHTFIFNDSMSVHMGLSLSDGYACWGQEHINMGKVATIAWNSCSTEALKHIFVVGSTTGMVSLWAIAAKDEDDEDNVVRDYNKTPHAALGLFSLGEGITAMDGQGNGRFTEVTSVTCRIDAVDDHRISGCVLVGIKDGSLSRLDVVLENIDSPNAFKIVSKERVWICRPFQFSVDNILLHEHYCLGAATAGSCPTDTITTESTGSEKNNLIYIASSGAECCLGYLHQTNVFPRVIRLHNESIYSMLLLPKLAMSMSILRDGNEKHSCSSSTGACADLHGQPYLSFMSCCYDGAISMWDVIKEEGRTSPGLTLRRSVFSMPAVDTHSAHRTMGLAMDPSGLMLSYAYIVPGIRIYSKEVQVNRKLLRNHMRIKIVTSPWVYPVANITPPPPPSTATSTVLTSTSIAVPKRPSWVTVGNEESVFIFSHIIGLQMDPRATLSDGCNSFGDNSDDKIYGTLVCTPLSFLETIAKLTALNYPEDKEDADVLGKCTIHKVESKSTASSKTNTKITPISKSDTPDGLQHLFSDMNTSPSCQRKLEHCLRVIIFVVLRKVAQNVCRHSQESHMSTVTRAVSGVHSCEQCNVDGNEALENMINSCYSIGAKKQDPFPTAEVLGDWVAVVLTSHHTGTRGRTLRLRLWRTAHCLITSVFRSDSCRIPSYFEDLLGKIRDRISLENAILTSQRAMSHHYKAGGASFSNREMRCLVLLSRFIQQVRGRSLSLLKNHAVDSNSAFIENVRTFMHNSSRSTGGFVLDEICPLCDSDLPFSSESSSSLTNETACSKLLDFLLCPFCKESGILIDVQRSCSTKEIVFPLDLTEFKAVTSSDVLSTGASTGVPTIAPHLLRCAVCSAVSITSGRGNRDGQHDEFEWLPDIDQRHMCPYCSVNLINLPV